MESLCLPFIISLYSSVSGFSLSSINYSYLCQTRITRRHQCVYLIWRETWIWWLPRRVACFRGKTKPNISSFGGIQVVNTRVRHASSIPDVVTCCIGTDSRLHRTVACWAAYVRVDVTPRATVDGHRNVYMLHCKVNVFLLCAKHTQCSNFCWRAELSRLHHPHQNCTVCAAVARLQMWRSRILLLCYCGLLFICMLT
jgi:hypothetical protein